VSSISEEQIGYLHTRATEMFRRVDLPARVPGKLLLHSMPGRFEAIEKAWQQVKSEAVGAIVCLVERYEIRLKSSAMQKPWKSGLFPVPCCLSKFLKAACPKAGMASGRL